MLFQDIILNLNLEQVPKASKTCIDQNYLERLKKISGNDQWRYIVIINLSSTSQTILYNIIVQEMWMLKGTS